MHVGWPIRNKSDHLSPIFTKNRESCLIFIQSNWSTTIFVHLIGMNNWDSSNKNAELYSAQYWNVEARFIRISRYPDNKDVTYYMLWIQMMQYIASYRTMGLSSQQLQRSFELVWVTPPLVVRYALLTNWFSSDDLDWCCWTTYLTKGVYWAIFQKF